jgi:hypothetical protein
MKKFIFLKNKFKKCLNPKNCLNSQKYSKPIIGPVHTTGHAGGTAPCGHGIPISSRMRICPARVASRTGPGPDKLFSLFLFYFIFSVSSLFFMKSKQL